MSELIQREVPDAAPLRSQSSGKCETCGGKGFIGYVRTENPCPYCRAPTPVIGESADDREAIARIINPTAFLDEAPDSEEPFHFATFTPERKRNALAKADLILALRPTHAGRAAIVEAQRKSLEQEIAALEKVHSVEFLDKSLSGPAMHWRDLKTRYRFLGYELDKLRALSGEC